MYTKKYHKYKTKYMNLKNDSKSNKENILHIAGFEKNNYFDHIY